MKLYLLFNRYLENKCSEDEIKLLSDYFDEAENESELKNLIKTEIESSDFADLDIASLEIKKRLKKIYQYIRKSIEETK